MFKRTKILATIGPASDNYDTIKEMALNGANAFRLNFSHGTHEYHEKNLNLIKEVEKDIGKRLGIFQDISGPKVRVGILEENFKLRVGDRLIFTKEQIVGKKVDENTYKLSINHPEILSLMKEDEYIYLYDGAIRAKVVKIGEDEIEAIIENDGMLTSNKGVNFPNTRINIDVITKKDLEDIKWGVKNGVNFMAISFVQSANDIIRVKDILKDLGAKNIQIYSKIEKFDAVENIDEIIEVSDGIMVARGDLGIEIPFYEVPVIQKMIIKKANSKSIPVITATQMMLSMTESDRATRAEISDVANAVLDGTDAVMLSEESAIGKHPAMVVKAMSKTIVETEKFYKFNKFDEFEFYDETDMVVSSTASLAHRLGADGIFCITGSNRSARKLSRNRPETRILAISHAESVAHSMTLIWGVDPILVRDISNMDKLLCETIKETYDKRLIESSKTYVLTAGIGVNEDAKVTNYIRIIKKDLIDHLRSL